MDDLERLREVADNAERSVLRCLAAVGDAERELRVARDVDRIADRNLIAAEARAAIAQRSSA